LQCTGKEEEPSLGVSVQKEKKVKSTKPNNEEGTKEEWRPPLHKKGQLISRNFTLRGQF